MYISTLQNIALFTCVKYKWQHSKLPNLTAQVSFRAKRFGENAQKTDDIQRKIEVLCDDVSDQIMDCNFLPYNVKVQWACSFSGLTVEINRFAIELVANIIDVNLVNAKYCVKRIVVSQEGHIDRVKTLLKIIKDSKFLLRIHKYFLIENFIDKEALIHISKSVLKSVQQKTTRARASSNNVYKKAIQKTLQNYNTLFENTMEVVQGPDGLIDMACTGNFLGLKYLYSKMKPLLKKHALLDTARYVIPRSLTQYGYDAEILMFFYQHIPEDELRPLVYEHSDIIINCLLGSWRYRHCCIEVYRMAIEVYDAETFRSLLNHRNWNWEYGKYDAHNIRQVFERIWFLTSSEVQKEAILSNEMANLIVCRMDFELLQILLHNLDVEVKQKVMAKIVVTLFVQDKGNRIENCLKLVPVPGFDSSNYKEMIPVELLREQFLNMKFARLPYNFIILDSFLRFFTNYFISDEDKSKSFRESLITQKECYKNVLIHKWHFIHWQIFMKWCLDGDEKRQEEHLHRCATDGLLLDAVKSTIDEQNIFLDELLSNTFRLPEEDYKTFERTALSDPEVRRKFHDNYLNMQSKDLYDKNFIVDLFTDKSSGVEAYREFMLSVDGIESILQMLCSLKHLLDHPNFELDFLKALNFYEHLKSTFARYNLVNEIDERLKARGHPNEAGCRMCLWRPTLAGKYAAVKPHEAQRARAVVDIKYRCFRTILNMNTSIRDYYTPFIGKDSFTRFSLNVASMVGLNIPVVV